MDINKIAIDSIESNTVKQYLYDIGHKFSIKEQISLIFNSNLELTKKVEVFNYIVQDENTPKSIVVKLEIILANVDRFLGYIYKNSNTALMFFDEDKDAKTIKNLDMLRIYLSEHNDIIDLNNIHVIDLMTSEIKYSFGLNKELNIIWFNNYVDSDYEYTDLQDCYVEIPNEFKIGDIVRICNSSEKYIVIQDSEIPEHLKSRCDFFDTCITVVPKSVFTDKSKSYKDQVEEIFKNRIKKIRDNEVINDILSEEHEHLSITIVEKV